MAYPRYWTRERVLEALRTGQRVSWSIVTRYWRTLNAARAEAGVPHPQRRIHTRFVVDAVEREE